MQIGAYQIERELGRGGFGVVYIGVDTRLGRRAALKQLLPDLSGNREIVERFFNEAKAAASINHPGIVEIYDVGWHTDGSAYFAMKLLDGDSLGRRLRARGPLPIGLACTIARQVASALVAAHGAGIVHRDLKPDNIILVRDDEIAIGERAVVLDFGIAKLGAGQGTSHTRSGMMMGTPNYMSPEQCKGAGEVDHRTDLYALGCILFELLTGRVPFVGEGPGEVMGMHQFVEPPLLRSLRPDAPEALESLIAQLLAKRLDQRMQQMTAVHAALQPFAGGMSREHPIAFGPTAPMPPVAPADPNAQTAISDADIKRQAPRVDAISAAARAANQPPLTAADVAAPKTTLSAASAEVAAAPPPPRKSRRLVLVLGGLALVGAVVVVAVVAGGSKTQTASDGPSGSVVNNVPPDAGTADAQTVATVDAGESVRDRCQRLKAEMNWNELARCADELKATDAGLGADFAKIAQRDSQAKIAYENMRIAIDAKNLVGAKASLDKIAADSIYRELAQHEYDVAAAKTAAGGAAGSAASAVNDALKGGAQTAIRVECQRLQAEKRWMDLVDCANRLTAAGDPQGKQFLATATKEAKAEEARKRAVTDAGADLCSDPARLADLKKQADAARVAQRYAVALASYELIAKCNPAAAAEAYFAACHAHEFGKADAYFRKFSATEQSTRVQTCLKEGHDPRAESPTAPAPAAAPKERARKLFEEGTNAYNVAQFEQAIEKFKAAYELMPDPVFLFNIAQAYRKLDDKPKAILFYKRYLALSPSAPNAAQVRQFITDLGGQP